MRGKRWGAWMRYHMDFNMVVLFCEGYDMMLSYVCWLLCMVSKHGLEGILFVMLRITRPVLTTGLICALE